MKQTYSVFIVESSKYVPHELGGRSITNKETVLYITLDHLESAVSAAKKLEQERNVKTIILPSYEVSR